MASTVFELMTSLAATSRFVGTRNPRPRACSRPASQRVVLPIPASPSTNSADGVLDAESRNSLSACSSMGRLAMPGKVNPVTPEESKPPSAARSVFKQFLGVARFDPGHRQHVEPPIELLQRQFVADQAPVDDRLADGLLLLERLLGHRGGLLIADRRIQWGDDGRRGLGQLAQARLVGDKAVDAALGEQL